MSNLTNSMWPAPAGQLPDPVPDRYLGVWSRTLLTTPEISDTSTYVRWMQLSQWHADLRVSRESPPRFQGFSGLTSVGQRLEGEVCTWQRWVDIEPARETADEGFMVFESSNRLVETGIHGVYREVWELLPDSRGQRRVLAEPVNADGTGGARLFVSGIYLIRLKPSLHLGPGFEISFGIWDGSVWKVEQSTITALNGQIIKLKLNRTSQQTVNVCFDPANTSEWSVLEWEEL